MSDKNGGAAFPHSGYGSWSPEGGMTLRDYFAAKALQGIVANEQTVRRFRQAAEAGGIDAEALVSTAAYSLADAMLKECAK